MPPFDPLADVPLVGDAHRAAVDTLSDTYRRVIHAWRPRLINITAETGVGKTRVVQEFYGRFAADDPYWPPALSGPNRRKEVAPERDRWSGDPKALWIGASCLRDDAGRVIPILEAALPRQARVHANGLLLRAKRSQARKGAVAAGAKAFAGLLPVQMLQQALEVIGRLGELREIAREIQDAIEPVDAPVEADRVNDEAVESLLAILDAVNAIGMSVVVVFDDAHNADATAVAAVERLLEGARGLLVVTTSWPTALATQRGSATGFGALVERLEPRGRIDVLPLAALTQDEIAELASRASAPRQDQPVAEGAAQAVAARADRNPLLLADLLRIAGANGLALTEANVGLLADLPRGFQRIFEAVWSMFLSDAARAHLQLAAALGTPVHERLLRAGATAVPAARSEPSAGAHDPLDEALRAGWLTAVADPFSDDLTVHFSERVMYDVAAAFAGELVQPTRHTAVERVAWAALGLDASTSSVARLEALQYAARLHLTGEDGLNAAPFPLLLFEIGILLWERDRSAGAAALQRAVRLVDALELPELDSLAATAADALTRLDRFDDALEILAIGGDPLLGHVVYVLSVADRYDEVPAAAQRALDLELSERGALHAIHQRVEQHVVAAIAAMALEASLMVNDITSSAAAVAVAQRAIEDALDRNLLSEATEIADAGIRVEAFDEDDLAAFEARGLPALSTITPQQQLESDFEPPYSLENLVELLAAGDYDGAAATARYVGTQDEFTEALPHLHELIDKGGPKYWYDMGVAARNVGKHATAVDAFDRALSHQRAELAETDRDVQATRFSLAHALAAHGEVERAVAVAHRAVEVAEAVGNDRLLAEALWVRVVALKAAGGVSEADVRDDLQRSWELLVRSGRVLRPGRVLHAVASALLDIAGDRGDWEAVAAITGELEDIIIDFDDLRRIRLIAWRLVALGYTDAAMLSDYASRLAQRHGLPATDAPRNRFRRLIADGAQALHQALVAPDTSALCRLMQDAPWWSSSSMFDIGFDGWTKRLVACGAVAQPWVDGWHTLDPEQRLVRIDDCARAWADTGALLGDVKHVAGALETRVRPPWVGQLLRRRVLEFGLAERAD